MYELTKDGWDKAGRCKDGVFVRYSSGLAGNPAAGVSFFYAVKLFEFEGTIAKAKGRRRFPFPPSNACRVFDFLILICMPNISLSLI